MYRIIFVSLLVATFVAYSSAVESCYGGVEIAGYNKVNCMTIQKDACHKIDCSKVNSNMNGKGCGKCPLGEMPGCFCVDCSEDMCNGATPIGSSFMLMWTIIGGVVTFLAMKPLVAIGIGI